MWQKLETYLDIGLILWRYCIFHSFFRSDPEPRSRTWISSFTSRSRSTPASACFTRPPKTTKNGGWKKIEVFPEIFLITVQTFHGSLDPVAVLVHPEPEKTGKEVQPGLGLQLHKTWPFSISQVTIKLKCHKRSLNYSVQNFHKFWHYF